MEQTMIVWSNVPDAELAKSIAHTLVQRRLAACVNILPAVQSVYQWQGAIEQAAEITLMIKTTQARYAELEAAIVELHPYEVPEIIALPIAAGLPAYLNWITAETRKDVHV